MEGELLTLVTACEADAWAWESHLQQNDSRQGGQSTAEEQRAPWGKGTDAPGMPAKHVLPWLPPLPTIARIFNSFLTNIPVCAYEWPHADRLTFIQGRSSHCQLPCKTAPSHPLLLKCHRVFICQFVSCNSYYPWKRSHSSKNGDSFGIWIFVSFIVLSFKTNPQMTILHINIQFWYVTFIFSCKPKYFLKKYGFYEQCERQAIILPWCESECAFSVRHFCWILCHSKGTDKDAHLQNRGRLHGSKTWGSKASMCHHPPPTPRPCPHHPACTVGQTPWQCRRRPGRDSDCSVTVLLILRVYNCFMGSWLRKKRLSYSISGWCVSKPFHRIGTC